MTIFLAMAQRKILWSRGLTAPFLRFCYVLNSLTLIPEKNITLHFIKKKQYTTETQKPNTDKKNTRHDKVSVTASTSGLLDENVKVSLLLIPRDWIVFFSAKFSSSNVKAVVLTRPPETVGGNHDISFEALFKLSVAGHIDMLFFRCFCL